MKYARNKYLMSNSFYADRMVKCILCAIIIITNYQTYIAPFSYTRSKAPNATAFGLQTCKVGLSIILHLFRLNMQLMNVKQNTTTKNILWEKVFYYTVFFWNMTTVFYSFYVTLANSRYGYQSWMCTVLFKRNNSTQWYISCCFPLIMA